MAETPQLHEILAQNIRALRLERSWSQDDMARHGREHGGLPWDRDTVNELEQGRRNLATGELLALCVVLDCDVAALLSSKGTVVLWPAVMSARLDEIRGRVKVRAVVAADPVVTTAERKAASVLGWTVGRVQDRARALWGRTLDVERDLRVGDPVGRSHRQMQAAKGHTTRKLLAELQGPTPSP